MTHHTDHPSDADLANRFTYHRPAIGQAEVYELLRDQAHQLALLVTYVAPSCREASLALTHLEDTVMWANAAIARHGLNEGGDRGAHALLGAVNTSLRHVKPDSAVVAFCPAGWDHTSE